MANLPRLESLYCGGNELDMLNLSELPRLLELYCGGNNFEMLDVTALSNLRDLECSSRNLKVLNVSGLPRLYYLDCDESNLKMLDASNLPRLVFLYCSDNNLESLNLSGTNKLGELYCFNNPITLFTASDGHTLKVRSEGSGKAVMQNYDFSSDTVYLTATPDSGRELKEWTGLPSGSVSGGNNVSFLLQENVEAAAIFTGTGVPTEGVSLDKATLSLYRGQTASLTAVVKPDNATNKALNWTSNAPGIAAADNGGTVTAHAAGTAVITVATKDGSHTASCMVTVSNPNSGGSSSGGSSSKKNIGTSEAYRAGIDGEWKLLDKENHKWVFALNNGIYIPGRWARISDTANGITNTYWYYFAADGAMVNGWFKDGNSQWYFLNTKHDGWFGRVLTGWYLDEQSQRWYFLDDSGAMVTGWRTIDGKSYYFHESDVVGSSEKPYGSMYSGEKTPDGYAVDQNGVWIQ